VLGLDEEGKTSIVKELQGKKKEDEVSQIDSFILNKAYKLMVFELSGKAYKTWPNFITNTDIVILVLSQMKSDSIEKLLSLIPEM
jgi:GTPase SAR1 family protein